MNTAIAALISPECSKKNPWVNKFNDTVFEEKAQDTAVSLKKRSAGDISDSQFCFLPNPTAAAKKSKSVESSPQTEGFTHG